MFKLLSELCSVFGPSGREEEILALVRKEVKPYADEITQDNLGSLMVLKRGRSDSKRVMFAAHVDEIGLAVTHIDERGFISFSTVGGVNIKDKMGGSRVRFQNGTIGVISHRDLMKKRSDHDVNEFYIDIGGGSREETLKRVQIGDFGSFEGPTYYQEPFFISKALDDRVGCFTLIEALKRIEKPFYDTWFVFTTQEEVGTRGAKTAAWEVDPNFALAVDVTLAGDNPESIPVNMNLGDGVAIKSRDRNIIVPTKVLDHLIALCDKNKISWQMEVLPFGGTDAGAIQLTRGGVPAGTLSIPCRYVHTLSEMVHQDDIAATIDLLVALCNSELPL